MIDPRETIDVEVDGETYPVRVLKRSERRQLLAMTQEMASLPESMEAVSRTMEIAEQVAVMILPTMDADERDSISEADIFKIAGECLKVQFIGGSGKKKLEPQPSSVQATSRMPALGDVFVTSSI